MDRAPETPATAGAVPEHWPCVRLDLAGFITEWPAAAQVFFGFEPQQALGQHLLFLSLHSEDEDWFDLGAAGANDGHAGARLHVFCRTLDGQPTKARLQLQLECDAQGIPSALNAHFEPLSLELTPAERQHLYRHLIENSSSAALLTDPKGRIVWVNSAFVELTGHPMRLALGHHLDWLCTTGSEPVRGHLIQTLHTQKHWSGEMSLRRPDGQTLAQSVRIQAVRDDQGHTTHALLLLFPAMAQPPSQGRPQVFDSAHLDPVTRLPNRLLLAQLLVPALAHAKRSGLHTAVLVLQLQRLDWVYDTLGHDSGDECLQHMVQRVLTSLREQDILARLGHDKLALVLQGLQQPAHAALVAHKIQTLLAEPFALQGHPVQLSACTGIALYPDNGQDAAALLRNAQTACHRAASGHEGTPQFFSKEMTLRATERFELEGDLRRAIARGELLLHHQPKVSLRNGAIVGAEALLRWQHPRHGLLTPARFVALAEETVLILELGEWVLNEACNQIVRWRDAGLQMPPLAVNLSVRQFDRQLPQRIERLLQQYRVAPQQLKLELTESLMARNPDEMLRIMNELAAMGLGLALDDFGTGYSSLSYLKRLPISTLKIDRSFVTGIPQQANDCAIAQAIITMGRQLRQEIVAEGVETRAQMEYLRALGCDQLQGYLFSPPLPVAEYERLVQIDARLAF